ncbi:aspartate carbamoyltransferase, partial [Candidatus Bipolaricaulota bacterium]|nr:aspartate carbamoyltransferase [Candidatus Bipolaricaulota bacterium]
AQGLPFEEMEQMEEALPHIDVLYMTRVQKERFFNEEDYLRLRDFYILTPERLKLLKEDAIVMHPLPRVTEISYAVDADPRAVYFQQVRFGMYARMALILSILGVA